MWDDFGRHPADFLESQRNGAHLGYGSPLAQGRIVKGVSVMNFSRGLLTAAAATLFLGTAEVEARTVTLTTQTNSVYGTEGWY